MKTEDMGAFLDDENMILTPQAWEDWTRSIESHKVLFSEAAYAVAAISQMSIEAEQRLRSALGSFVASFKPIGLDVLLGRPYIPHPWERPPRPSRRAARRRHSRKVKRRKVKRCHG